MKIRELFENLFTQNQLTNKFPDEDSLKKEIVKHADFVMAAYKEKGPKKHGMVAFSNDIANKIRMYTLTRMAQQYQIHSNQELDELKALIFSSLSDHYMEYKLNGNM